MDEPRRRLPIATVAALMAASAWYGATGLITGYLAAPDGLVARLPFASPGFGGAALAVVVAAPTTITTVAALRRRSSAGGWAVFSGVLLVGWIVVELGVVREFSPLQPLCAAGGTALVMLGTHRRRQASRLPARPTGLPASDVAVDLYWLPLGAGGRVVRRCGRLFERVAALRQRRRPQELYHSALEVSLDCTRWVIEMAPVWSERSPARGVVQEGAVGVAWLGRSRLFRYEVRRWPGGRIPDVDEAVASPVRLSSDAGSAAAVLAVVADVPAFVWGRDELRCGDMWNSNSLIAWALACTGHGTAALAPPGDGRAPGWRAGLVLAQRGRPIEVG